jgi:hypothetical protein
VVGRIGADDVVGGDQEVEAEVLDGLGVVAQGGRIGAQLVL